MDFGIARKFTLQEEAGRAAAEVPAHPDGTYGYIAPEEKAGRGVDGRADIYALGILLHRSVTGRSPEADGGLGQAAGDLAGGGDQPVGGSGGDHCSLFGGGSWATVWRVVRSWVRISRGIWPDDRCRRITSDRLAIWRRGPRVCLFANIRLQSRWS